MGLFGSDKQEGEKKCPNCHKPLKEGEGVRKVNGHFCCDKCCEVGERAEKKMTCEFC